MIQYLAKTRDLGLVYTGKGSDLVGYSDASLGRSDPEGHSTSGGVVKLFGDSIGWFTSRQKVVATSSMEAVRTNAFVVATLYTRSSERWNRIFFHSGLKINNH